MRSGACQELLHEDFFRFRSRFAGGTGLHRTEHLSERDLEELVGIERRRPTEFRGADRRERLLDTDPGQRLRLESLLNLPPRLARPSCIVALYVNPKTQQFRENLAQPPSPSALNMR